MKIALWWVRFVVWAVWMFFDGIGRMATQPFVEQFERDAKRRRGGGQ